MKVFLDSSPAGQKNLQDTAQKKSFLRRFADEGKIFPLRAKPALEKP